VNTEIRDNAVLSQTTWCAVREQEDQYLIYNRKTDELHLLPPTAHCVFQLCDGLNTVSDIVYILADVFHTDISGMRHVLDKYLSSLLERGIVEMALHE